jgi:hypothetical protein
VKRRAREEGGEGEHSGVVGKKKGFSSLGVLLVLKARESFSKGLHLLPKSSRRGLSLSMRGKTSVYA